MVRKKNQKQKEGARGKYARALGREYMVSQEEMLKIHLK